MTEPVQSVPILMYHSVADDPPAATRRLSVPPHALEWQLDLLRDRGFTGLTFSEVAQSLRSGVELPARPVVLTFDDGYADFARQAAPILRRHGFPSTVFVTTGWVSDADEESAGAPLDRMMTWGQIEELAASGVEIGAHSHSHPQLDQLPEAALRHELEHSRALIEDRIGLRVRTMAYPFGYASSRVRHMVSGTGYECAAAVNNVRATSGHDCFMLPRLTIRRDTYRAPFEAAVTGADGRMYWKDRALTAGYGCVRGVRRLVKRRVLHG